MSETEFASNGWLPIITAVAQVAAASLLVPAVFLIFRTLRQARRGARQAQLAADKAAVAAEQAKRAAEAQFIAMFLEELALPKLQDSIALMTEWRDNWPAAVRQAWQRCDETNAADRWRDIEHVYSDKVRQAQERLSRYFNKAWQLSRSGYLSDEAMTIIIDPQAYVLLFDIVRPLAQLARHRPNGTPFDGNLEWIEEMRTRHGDGNAELSQTKPPSQIAA